MALQGTVESFPVVDVVGLLAGGSHTGHLAVDGDRGRSVLRVADGALLGGELDGTEQLDLVHLVTETLRQRTGTFVFEPGPVEAGGARVAAPAALSEVLADAEQRLEQWAAVEAVIPTVEHRLRLSSALPVESVTLDRAQWALVASAAHRPEVRQAATELGMDELTACQLASAMVTLGLLVVEAPDDAASFLADLPYDAPVLQPSSLDEPVLPLDDATAFAIASATADVPAAALDPAVTADEVAHRAGHFPIDDLIGSGPDDDWGHMAEPAPPSPADPFAAVPEPRDQAPAPLDHTPLDHTPLEHAGTDGDEVAFAGPVFAGLPEATELPELQLDHRSRLGAGPVDDVELRRQLADLSPRAAEAIAAALESLPDDPTA